MGNSPNGKDDHSYYAQQLSLFRWRADPNHNAHLPRVRFAKRQQYLQKYRFGMMVEDQLQQHLFLDVDAIWQNIKEEGVKKGGEVIVFEQFVARLDELENTLELSECIYVLMALIEGYQRILYRLGKTHIEPSFCFVTPEGDIRAWFSDNPATNDLAQQLEEGRKVAVYSSQAGVVKRVMELTKKLSLGSGKEFWEELRQFVKGNMLKNCNFSSVRRFVNRYLFKYRIDLPSGLGKALRRTKAIKFDGPSSQDKINIKEDSHIAPRGQLSTYTQLDYLQPAPSLHQHRQTSSFSMKGDSPHCETACRTPKTQNKLSPLDSTFIHSQLLLSRGIDSKKVQSFHKSRKDLSKQQAPQQKQNKNSCIFPQKSLAFLKKRKATKMGTRSGKVSVKFHSRQQSEDQQSNSMFLSPANEQIQLGVHYSHVPQVNHWQKQSEHPNQDFSQLASVDKLTSQHLARQVSGLVSNKELSICESMGTFQSIAKSKDSGYMGILSKMGRTAKMLNFPTGKRLATFFRHNAQQPNSH